MAKLDELRAAFAKGKIPEAIENGDQFVPDIRVNIHGNDGMFLNGKHKGETISGLCAKAHGYDYLLRIGKFLSPELRMLISRCSSEYMRKARKVVPSNASNSLDIKIPILKQHTFEPFSDRCVVCLVSKKDMRLLGVDVCSGAKPEGHSKEYMEREVEFMRDGKTYDEFVDSFKLVKVDLYGSLSDGSVTPLLGKVTK